MIEGCSVGMHCMIAILFLCQKKITPHPAFFSQNLIILKYFLTERLISHLKRLFGNSFSML